MQASSLITSLLKQIKARAEGLSQKKPERELASLSGVEPLFDTKESAASGFRELLSNTLEFDIGALLHPKSFLYLLCFLGTGIFQIYNTLTIKNLALQNEKLRVQIQLTSSVITSQELKVHELHSIHNIAADAAALGLAPSSVPAVEL